MVNIDVEKQRLVDFSFMPSLKCNLSCPHCMYRASPKNDACLDADRTAGFISTIDFGKINAVGFYGGEISCDYRAYQRIVDMIPREVVKFTITNGTWTIGGGKIRAFLDFAGRNNLQVFVSDTEFHRPFQNRSVLETLAREGALKLKSDDHVIPMGRAHRAEWNCSAKCLGYKNPMRLTLNPSGEIMFCNCDGIYPVVGSYEQSFGEAVENAANIGKFCKRANAREVQNEILSKAGE
jgi:hypothetical protein